MSNLPTDVISLVLKLVASDSTHKLKPLTLLCRHWRSCVSPLLLKTVSVTSLGSLVNFCNFIIGTRIIGDFSYFEHFTTTIVLSGNVDFHAVYDPTLGRSRYIEPDGFTTPDTDLREDEIDAIISDSLARFRALGSLEWYGRFAGDELLVVRLQREANIHSITMGIGTRLHRHGFTYSPNFFSFGNLTNLTFMTRHKPEQNSIRGFIEIAHRSPQLQRIVFQRDGDGGHQPAPWSLLDLICDQSQPNGPIRTWPNLKYLELHYFSAQIWSSEANAQKFIKFLVSHDGLECLVLKPRFWSDEGQAFSLAAYPDALPNLRRIYASLGFICGVCDSVSACASLRYVFSPSSERHLDPELFNRFIASFSRLPRSSLKRLRISTPAIGPAMFSQFARIAPYLEFLEVVPPRNRFEGDHGWVIPTGESDPLSYIPRVLAQFPRLRIIGHEPAAQFILPYRQAPEAFRESPNTWVLRLAKAIPQIEAIVVCQGHMLEIVRDDEGNPSLRVGDTTRLDHLDYDWLAYHADWPRRPVSLVEERERYKDNTITVDEFCQLLSR